MCWCSRPQSQASIEKAVSTLGIEAMRAAQTAVVIGEDNRLAQTAVKDATGEEVSLGAQKQESGAVDVADLDVSVLDGSLVDGSNSSPKSVMPSATETLRPRKNSGGASAIKVCIIPHVALRHSPCSLSHSLPTLSLRLTLTWSTRSPGDGAHWCRQVERAHGQALSEERQVCHLLTSPEANVPRTLGGCASFLTFLRW